MSDISLAPRPQWGVAACEPLIEGGAGASFNTSIFGFSQNDTYQVTITTADGTFTDQGLFRAVFYREQLDNPLNGYDESFHGPWALPRRLLPRAA